MDRLVLFLQDMSIALLLPGYASGNGIHASDFGSGFAGIEADNKVQDG